MPTKKVSDIELCEIVAMKLAAQMIGFKFEPIENSVGEFTVGDADSNKLQRIIDEGIDWGQDGGPVRG